MTAKRRKSRIGVVGLGYVGLPLAVEFGKQYETVGFDVNPKRVAQLRRGRDLTLEVTPAELKAAQLLSFTTELDRLRRCQVFIVTVPTPIDEYKRVRAVRRLCKTKHVLYDIKHVFPAAAVDGRL